MTDLRAALAELIAIEKDWRGYERTADILAKRIADLIPAHPEILTMESCWDLFKIPGFKCDDLQPSMAQAGWALAKAKQLAADGGKQT